MNSIILFLISYTVMFLIYLIFFYVRGLKKKTILNSMQVEYLKIRFNFQLLKNIWKFSYKSFTFYISKIILKSNLIYYTMKK